MARRISNNVRVSDFLFHSLRKCYLMKNDFKHIAISFHLINYREALQFIEMKED